MEITTIKLEKKTKQRLDKLKISKNETYEEVIQKMLSILNICTVNPSLAREKLKDIYKLRTSFSFSFKS